MQLGKIVEGKEALANLSKGNLPIHIAWELKKFIKSVDTEVLAFEEVRNQKIREMGEQVGDVFTVKPENLPRFNSEIIELLDKDIQVNIPEINIQQLLEYKDSQGKQIDISATDLIKLDWLIKE